MAPAAVGATSSAEASAQASVELPGWTPKAREVAPLSREEAVSAIGRAVQEVQQGRLVPLSRLGTSARCVLKLWTALGRPPLTELADELALVAAWARESPDRLAARDLRAEGWEGQPDRSRSVDTLCRQARWADRLEAARAWHAAGRPQASATRPLEATAPDAARGRARIPPRFHRTTGQDPFEALHEEESPHASHAL